MYSIVFGALYSVLRIAYWWSLLNSSVFCYVRQLLGHKLISIKWLTLVRLSIIWYVAILIHLLFHSPRYTLNSGGEHRIREACSITAPCPLAVFNLICVCLSQDQNKTTRSFEVQVTHVARTPRWTTDATTTDGRWRCESPTSATLDQRDVRRSHKWTSWQHHNNNGWHRSISTWTRPQQTRRKYDQRTEPRASRSGCLFAHWLSAPLTPAASDAHVIGRRQYWQCRDTFIYFRHRDQWRRPINVRSRNVANGTTTSTDDDDGRWRLDGDVISASSTASPATRIDNVAWAVGVVESPPEEEDAVDRSRCRKFDWPTVDGNVVDHDGDHRSSIATETDIGLRRRDGHHFRWLCRAGFERRRYENLESQSGQRCQTGTEWRGRATDETSNRKWYSGQRHLPTAEWLRY